MSHRFYTLDVFTAEPLAGNQLAVVLDADDLGAEVMQKIAAEFNIAETVFVLAPENPAHSARIRIFTPAQELPFAGHPTAGAAILLAHLKFGGEASTEQDAVIVLEEEVGIVRAGVRLPPRSAPYTVFDLPKLPAESRWAPQADVVARAVGLLESDLNFDNHRMSRFDAGVPYAFVPVRGLEAMRRAKPVSTLWADAFGRGNHSNAYLYCRETREEGSSFHARMFWPGAGIPEDPATGSAVAALAGVVAKFDPLPDGEHVLKIEQGYEIGRRSLITLEVVLAAGRLENARIGGHAVIVQEGTLRI